MCLFCPPCFVAAVCGRALWPSPCRSCAFTAFAPLPRRHATPHSPLQVGPTVNCGGVLGRHSPGTPHLQSYLLATDAVGLGVLRAVLRCLDDKFDTVLASEMGATAAVLAAGYSFDSLMLRYQVGAAAAGVRVLAAGARAPSTCAICNCMLI